MEEFRAGSIRLDLVCGESPVALDTCPGDKRLGTDELRTGALGRLQSMAEVCRISVNGKELFVPPGTSVAAALMMAQVPCRISVTGEPRASLCGMGICMECRATVNGVAHTRTCQLVCTANMEVGTG
jgi:hypothetical protein